MRLPRPGACVISRVALGVMSDKQSPHRLGFFAMAASAVAVSILWGVACESRPCISLACWRSQRASALTLGWTCAATTFAPLVVFALVMGLCSGGWTSLYSAIIKSLVGALSRLLCLVRMAAVSHNLKARSSAQS